MSKRRPYHLDRSSLKNRMRGTLVYKGSARAVDAAFCLRFVLNKHLDRSHDFQPPGSLPQELLAAGTLQRYLHGLPLLHGELKPENVLIFESDGSSPSQRPTAKITDAWVGKSVNISVI